MARARRMRPRSLAKPKTNVVTPKRKLYRPGSVDTLPVDDGFQVSGLTRFDHRRRYTRSGCHRSGINAYAEAKRRYEELKAFMKEHKS